MNGNTDAGLDTRTDEKVLNPNKPAEYPGADLTQFQLRALAIIHAAETPPCGLDIKARLEGYFCKEIRHGRLYPNLDDLVDAGYVDKRSKDGRTNEYRTTDAGAALLDAELTWLAAHVEPEPKPEVATDGGIPTDWGAARGAADRSPDRHHMTREATDADVRAAVTETEADR